MIFSALLGREEQARSQTISKSTFKTAYSYLYFFVHHSSPAFIGYFSSQRDGAYMRRFFREVYMDSVFPITHSAEIPPYIWGNNERELVRKHCSSCQTFPYSGIFLCWVHVNAALLIFSRGNTKLFPCS